jgi:hypothetical protein
LAGSSQGLDEWKVSEFLKRFRGAVEAGRLLVIPRGKNNEFLARHGMNTDEREEVLISLTFADYESGPEEDRDHTGEKDIWKFNAVYLGIKIHIKIKLAKDQDVYYAKCLSFHD